MLFKFLLCLIFQDSNNLLADKVLLDAPCSGLGVLSKVSNTIPLSQQKF